MWVLIWSGLLYIAGVAILLVWRPSLMFNEEGEWKEFRIGGDRSKYTWMPVWLALLLWALFCFTITSLIFKKKTSASGTLNTNTHTNTTRTIIDDGDEGVEEVVQVRKRRGRRVALPPGYYVLDREANNRTGTPHYVYIGESPMEDE
jgi:hypothetical protein